MNIAVIGLGKAGLPLASVIADRDIRVIGVDIDAKRCEAINRGINPIPEEAGLDELIKKHGGKNLKATSKYEDAESCDVFIIIVPLFIDENHNPDFKILESAFRNVGKVLKKGALVVLETTVPPGTTETKAKNWLEEESKLKFGDFYLAHSPERIMTGYSISRLKEFQKVIGGVDEESGIRALEVYKTFIPDVHRVSSARVAEFIKIAEGCYRDTNIALANELFKIADALKIDFNEAREYANHKYCQIHMPSTGVGGHCIPVYPWFLIHEMEKKEKYDYCRFLRTSREQNDMMVNFWADKIIMECGASGKKLADVKICIKGITFRDGVKEPYHSRNLFLAKLLKEKGMDVYAYDAQYTEKELESLGLKFIEPKNADLVFDSFSMKIDLRKRY